MFHDLILGTCDKTDINTNHLDALELTIYSLPLTVTVYFFIDSVDQYLTRSGNLSTIVDPCSFSTVEPPFPFQSNTSTEPHR